MCAFRPTTGTLPFSQFDTLFYIRQCFYVTAIFHQGLQKLAKINNHNHTKPQFDACLQQCACNWAARFSNLQINKPTILH